MSLFQFNEAAKLYAANVDVINAMHEKFKTESARFLEALRDAIAGHMGDLPLQVTDMKSGWVYVYASADWGTGVPSQPCLLLNRNSTEITQGSLTVWAYAEGASPEQRRKLKVSLNSKFSTPGLDNFTWTVGTDWKDKGCYLASLETDSPDGFDMALLGQVCARLLLFVDDEYRALLKSNEEALPPNDEGA